MIAPHGLTDTPRPRSPFTHKLRHVVRVLALGAATFCAASSITGRAGSIAAVVGAVLGVILGEIIGRRRMRLWLVAVVAVAFGLLGVWLGSMTRRSWSMRVPNWRTKG